VWKTCYGRRGCPVIVHGRCMPWKAKKQNLFFKSSSRLTPIGYFCDGHPFWPSCSPASTNNSCVAQLVRIINWTLVHDFSRLKCTVRPWPQRLCRRALVVLFSEDPVVFHLIVLNCNKNKQKPSSLCYIYLLNGVFHLYWRKCIKEQVLNTFRYRFYQSLQQTSSFSLRVKH